MKRVVMLALLCAHCLLFAAPHPGFLALLNSEEQAFLAQHPSLTVLVDPAMAPLEYLDAQTSTPRGVTVAYLDELHALTGITFECVIDHSWKRAYQRFVDGSIDMAIALNRSVEREKHFLFTEPYLSMPIVLMAASQVGYIDGLADIGDRLLAMVDEYSVVEWIEADYPELNTIKVATTEEGLDLVKRGDAFAMVGNLMVLNHYLSIKGMTDHVKVVGVTPYANEFSMAVQKELAPLLGIVEKGLSLISDEAKLRLHSQNLPPLYDWVISRKSQFWILLSIATLLEVFILWIYTLVRQIRRSEDAEHEMVESERKFRLIFEDSPNPLMIVDSAGVILDVNKSWTSLFGLGMWGLTTMERLLHSAYPDEDARIRLSQLWDRILSGNVSDSSEGTQKGVMCELVDSRGSYHTVEVSGAPLPDSILVTFQDLTEQTRTLLRIKELHQEAERSRMITLSALEDQQLSDQSLKESRATLEAAIHSMFDAVYIIDATGSFVMVNNAFYDYYRFTSREQTPPTLHEFKNLFEIFDEQGKPIRPIMMVGLKALSGKSGTEEYRVHKVGTDHWWYGSYSFAPILDSEGKVAAAIVVCRDVTEERMNQQKLLFQRDHDYLTGLYSRVHFEEVLASMEETVPTALGLVDINGLKLVNDTLGHAMGDEVIKRTAELLIEELEEGTFIARYGGDEFAFLMPGRDEAAAEMFIKRVERAAKEISFETFHLSLSSGLACRTFLGETLDETLRRAEEMMERAKLYESASAKSKSVSLLMNSLFAKSMRESQHSRRVSDLCSFLARQLDLSEQEVNRMRTAGLMHDIGKIGISETILNKPGKLSREEWAEVKRHPEIGYRILSAVAEFSDLALAILEHHERWDGSGYPQGLKAEQISYQARIIAIADSYDAMTGVRPYRKPVGKEEAIEEIFNNRGILYDPQIVQVFVSTIGQFES